MIERFLDILPFLLLLGFTLASIIWTDKRLAEQWGEIVKMNKRLQAAEQGLEEVDKTLSNYPEWQRAVNDLERGFQKIREREQCRDPLDAIIKEARGLKRS